LSPVDTIPILLTVDWLLDRFRMTSNVLGEMAVAVLLDGVAPPARSPIETPELDDVFPVEEQDGNTPTSHLAPQSK
jgi:hypothetical protein